MTLVRRPAVAAGRHYVRADGPSKGSASCVITGDCDDDQLFGASRKTCHYFAVCQQLGHKKERTVFESTVNRNYISCNSDDRLMICMKMLTPNFNPRY